MLTSLYIAKLLLLHGFGLLSSFAIIQLQCNHRRSVDVVMVNIDISMRSMLMLLQQYLALSFGLSEDYLAKEIGCLQQELRLKRCHNLNNRPVDNR